MSATPGPWYAFVALKSKYRDQATIAVHSSPAFDQPSCIVHWTGFDACDLGVRTKAANARLIAAAPNLADALFNLLSALGQHEQPADVVAACEAASAALIASGRVIG